MHALLGSERYIYINILIYLFWKRKEISYVKWYTYVLVKLYNTHYKSLKVMMVMDPLIKLSIFFFELKRDPK